MRRQYVSEYYRGGMTQAEIAARLGVSQPTVYNDLKLLRAEWREKAAVHFSERQAEELAKIDLIETKAWGAFERSVAGYNSFKSRRKHARLPVLSPKGKPTGKFKRVLVEDTAEKVRTEGVGDPRFLERVGWCIETRCRILGLLREEKGAKAEVNFALPPAFWDALTKPPAEDWEEAEIAAAVNGTEVKKLGDGGGK